MQKHMQNKSFHLAEGRQKEEVSLEEIEEENRVELEYKKRVYLFLLLLRWGLPILE